MPQVRRTFEIRVDIVAARDYFRPFTTTCDLGLSGEVVYCTVRFFPNCVDTGKLETSAAEHVAAHMTENDMFVKLGETNRLGVGLC